MFNNTLAFVQASTGVKVAVGLGFIMTEITVLSLQPLLLVTFNLTGCDPEVVNVVVGFCEVLSVIPLLSKSQAHEAIVPGEATVDKLVKEDVLVKHTGLAENEAVGIGNGKIVMVILSL